MKKDWKGCPPRVRRLGIVDDDEASRDTLVELVQRDFPKLTVHGFSSLFEAYRGITTYDYLLIDVTSVAPSFTLGREWAPIAKYAEEYPATQFILCSAMSRNALNDVIDECVEAGVARERFHLGGFMWDSSAESESIKATLHRLIKPEDMEWTKLKKKI